MSFFVCFPTKSHLDNAYFLLFSTMTATAQKAKTTKGPYGHQGDKGAMAMDHEDEERGHEGPMSKNWEESRGWWRGSVGGHQTGVGWGLPLRDGTVFTHRSTTITWTNLTHSTWLPPCPFCNSWSDCSCWLTQLYLHLPIAAVALLFWFTWLLIHCVILVFFFFFIWKSLCRFHSWDTFTWSFHVLLFVLSYLH